VSDDDLPSRIVLGDGATMSFRQVDLAIVVEVSGLADATVTAQLAAELVGLEPDVRVVVDLSDAVLVGPAALCDLLDEVVAAGEDPDRVCVVCERLSTQVLLRRYGATEQAAVFSTVNDALQALVLKNEGYGSGWAPGHAHAPR
jgi:hypothetical protein